MTMGPGPQTEAIRLRRWPRARAVHPAATPREPAPHGEPAVWPRNRVPHGSNEEADYGPSGVIMPITNAEPGVREPVVSRRGADNVQERRRRLGSEPQHQPP
jgi:hypothetical protein